MPAPQDNPDNAPPPSITGRVSNTAGPRSRVLGVAGPTNNAIGIALTPQAAYSPPATPKAASPPIAHPKSAMFSTSQHFVSEYAAFGVKRVQICCFWVVGEP